MKLFFVLILISNNAFCVIEKIDDPVGYFNEEYNKYSAHLSYGGDGWYSRRSTKGDRRARYAAYMNGKLIASQRRHLIFNEMMKKLKDIDYFNDHDSFRKCTEDLKQDYVISYSNPNINNNEDYLVDNFLDLFIECFIKEISHIIGNVLKNIDEKFLLSKYNAFVAADYYNKLTDLYLWVQSKGLFHSKKERFKSHEREILFLCSKILKIKKLMQEKPQQAV